MRASNITSKGEIASTFFVLCVYKIWDPIPSIATKNVDKSASAPEYNSTFSSPLIVKEL